MSDDAEIVKEFLIESYENLDRLDQDLIALEKDSGNRDTLASVFRTIHTIKGTSGFLAFNRLGALTHVGENLLTRLRDGLLALNPEITTGLLRMVDAVRQMLKSIEETGKEGDRNDENLIANLTRLLEPAAKPNSGPEGHASASEARAAAEPAPASHRPMVEQPNQVAQAHSEDPLPDKKSAKTAESSESQNAQSQAKGQSASDSTIRIDVGQLDRLINRVGELVLLRNQIAQYTNSTEDSELLGTSQRLNLLTTELQESVMKTRMQPIGNIWSKFPRTVRDLALSCGKQVRIEMEGKETELDKTIIEAIKDPLTHLVRNSVDHGVETPERRLAAGKQPEGCLLLRAFHEGGQVNIEVTDDGAGLDCDRLRKKAVEKGLITPDQAARMSEREATNLIFLPGFSTAEKVTNVSGRGVGMDVVKTNIEKIGGTVDMQSKRGLGSTVRMKIPLTLAIIPALIVTSAGDRYAIPQVSLLELVRLEGESARKGIEMINGAPVHRLRGHLLPLVYLKGELKVNVSAQGSSSSEASNTSNNELVDFSLARKAHKDWVERLRAVLDGKMTMTLDQAGSHKQCALGKWIYATGLQYHGDIVEMCALEKAHKGFHNMVRDIITLKRDGFAAQAERQFRDVEPASTKIVELLMTIENKVSESQNVNIVVLQADDRQFGLVVDEINDTEEIVVKPLGKQLKSINIYAGATIMGDGKVALILDVLGLAQRARVLGDMRDQEVAEKEEKTQSIAAADKNQCKPMLLFQHGETGRMAIDLALVARLEEFSRDLIEIAGDRQTVQYRGQIMPLVWVSHALESKRKIVSDNGHEPLHVVVYANKGRSVGLVVDRILDIVEESFVIQPETGRSGVLGSAVIQKRVTDIVDLQALVASASTKTPSGAQT